MIRLIQGTYTLLFSLYLLRDTLKNANAFNLPIPVRTKQKLLLRHMASRVESMTAAEGVMQEEDLESIIMSGENISTAKEMLQIDESGRLRIQNGPVLLDGLDSNAWTGIPAVHRDNENDQDGCSSLFLQVTHSKERAAQHEFSLGSLVTCNRLLACARLTRYWMGPAFGTNADDIPLDTQFLLVEVAENGPYALVLPLVDAGFRTSLEYSKEKEEIGIICYSESGDASVTPDGMKALYVAVGDDPFELVQRGFQEVADNMGTFRTLHEKKIPKSVDDFGWCTWDAFYSEVNPAGILEGVSALKKAGVPPRNIILDDGWQEVTPHPSNWKAEEASDAKPGMISRLGNAAFGKVAALFTGYYDNYAKTAAHGTISNRVWTLLSRTVLKKGLWKFFDSETDFNRQLDGFEPNFKFQDSDGTVESMTLKNLVHELKTELGLKRVYCWHALHGYWRGVSSELGDSIGIDVLQIRTKPTEHLMRMEPQMGFDTISLFGVGMITDKEDLAKFYQHLHEPLVAAGVDGVKVDVQSGVSAAGSGVRGVAGGPHIGQIYTEAMEDSVSQHFASETTGAVDCINCMCHSTENLYRYKVTAVARASDDFYPRRPESHSVHLVNVAYNSLFLGEICLPDWDMFQSKHVSAELHGAARAVGGCPVYVSDVPGQHNVHLLKKLVLPDGSVLRAQLPGRPTRDCLFTDVGQDGESALKIWNTNKAGGGVVGAFNVQGVAWNFDTNENEEIDPSPSRVVASVKPHDVESLRTMDGPFAVWNHRSSALKILESGESTIEAPLDSHEWDIFTISPVQSSGDVKWAAIGLGDMLNSGGAILYQSSLEEVTTTTNTTGDGLWRQTTTASITTRGPGRFVAYCEPAPTTIIINDGMGSIPSELPFAYNEDTQLLEFVLPNEAEENGAHQVTIAWDNRP